MSGIDHVAALAAVSRAMRQAGALQRARRAGDAAALYRHLVAAAS